MTISRILMSEALLLQQELAADGLDIELLRLSDPFSGMGELRLAFHRAADGFTFMTVDFTLDSVDVDDTPHFSYSVYTNYSGYQGYNSRQKAIDYMVVQLRARLTSILEDQFAEESYGGR